MSIQLKSISEVDYEAFDGVYKQYTTTFPPKETRSKSQFYGLIDNTYAAIYHIIFLEEIVGYIILWELAQGIFIEHFEIFPTHRNMKLGEKVLTYLKDNYPMVILETEPVGYSDMAERRIQFYERNNFYVIDKHHIQPAYQENMKELMLYLMCSDKDADAYTIQKEMLARVYNF